MKQIYLTIIFLFALLGGASAQKLTVESMEPLLMDLSASQYERKDLNGQPCALVKVQLATMGARFEGNVVGSADYKTGEYWVYMTEGSYLLSVKHPSFVPLSVNFRDYGINGLQGKATYRLTLLMPQMGNMNVDDGMRYLAMTVEPKNATLTVNDQQHTTTNGEFAILLPKGTYDYEVSAPNCASQKGHVILDDNTTPLNVRLANSSATLKVSCSTAGAQIYVNGQQKGTGSWTGSVSPGYYKVEARLAGYQSYSETLNLSANADRTLNIPALQALTGMLNVNYSPIGSDVYIDGQKVGTTPNIFRSIPIGQHHVEVRKDGYTTHTQTITIEENKPAELSGSLTAVSVGTSIASTMQVPDPKSSKSVSGKEMTLNQMVTHPLGVLTKNSWGKEKKAVMDELKAARNWEVLENMGGDVHVDDYDMTYMGKVPSAMCGFTYNYNKSSLSHFKYTFYFEKEADATSFYNKIIAQLKAEGGMIQPQQGTSDSDRTINASCYGQTMTMSQKKNSSYKKKHIVYFDVYCSNESPKTSDGLLTNRTFTVNGVSFTMVYVEGGTFTMGATSEQGSDAYDEEKPTHSVTLSNYYIGETEVTQGLWEAVMGSNPSSFKGDSRLPVESVSWEDCQRFISKLNSMTGQQFRLPTEAQWEYASRGGSRSKGYKYSGSNDLGSVAWYYDNSGSKTHAVKTKSANELGLYDMSGNVSEWCSDWYGSYSSGSQTNPTGASSGSYRVRRGGSWIYNTRDCRSALRKGSSPSYCDNYLGLRLAL